MNSLKWWQKAVFYQIYPRSFADGNNDGIGDFPGITARLDYLCELGIDAIWLSPHYPSPFLDCGYDISDYTGVGPEYGTLEDFKHFLTQAHDRNIRVILDLVLNHSSDQHHWFTESRSSLDNPKRDWYIWRDGIKAGGPPNNWLSIFGGSAWELDPTTGQYFYHAFLKEQPDLNWRNPQLKQAMWEVVRFWLNLGVDGFRLDAVATIFEDPSLPDHTYPVADSGVVLANELTKIEYEQLMQYQTHQPGIHELLKELRALVDGYPGDRVLIGEDENVIYHGSGDDELHLVFNFPLMATPKLTPTSIRANQAVRLGDLPPGAWPCNTLGHHDIGRLWNRYGDGQHDDALARLHLALLLTLKGTPFIYNGDEIGMTDLELTGPDQLRDTSAINLYRVMTETLGIGAEEAFKRVAIFTRDRSRSPFQWSSEPNSGFSPPGVQTWLPVNPDYARGVNVEAQENKPDSILNFYRCLLKVRRTTPALVAGEYLVLNPESEDYLAFLRYDSAAPQTCLVLLNFSDHEQRVHFKMQGNKELTVIFSSDAEKGKKAIPAGEGLTLEPLEVFVALVS
ncbi:MAG: alpha-glucosidase [Chloroflexi bacterium]|nr:alpha-glucosidase [Chloroflexota bacterium]OJV90088.1 MAG: glucohydrolase [Chloroflexi bacterium 54-19]